MPENWSWRTRQITDMQMRQRDVAAPDAKYTKELAERKLKMMLCVMMLPLVVVGCTSKQSVSQCVKLPPPPAIMQPPPTGRHCWMGLFHPQRELGSLFAQKQLEGTQKYINEQKDRASARWATHVIIVSNNNNALPAEYKCSKYKPSNPFTNVAGFSF